MADQIKLISLTFRYFKGLINFTLQADGSDVDVYGDNAAGKTSLFDGFSWLLFDKDSRDKAQPEKWIKTLGTSGEPLHGIEHEVEGVLEINGQRRTFRKVFSEKWTKKRGSAKSEFNGHTTDYFIDGAPLGKGDYNSEIAGIISEDKFKLLTSPTYFNEQLDWKKRRQLLLEVCGDVSDGEVIESNEALSRLPEMMEGRTLDRHREKIKADQKRINDELEDIPIRISEVQRGMPDTGGLDEKTMQQQIEALRGRIESKEAEQSRIQSGGEIAVKTNRLREIEGELIQIKNAIQSGSLDKTSIQRQVLSKHRSQVAEIEDQIKRTEQQIATLTQKSVQNDAELQSLRHERDHLKSSVFEHVGEDTCAACGQALPEDEIEAARQKAEEQFNLRKSKSLETIIARGKAAKLQAEQWADEISKLNNQLQSGRDSLISAINDMNAAKSALEQMEDATQDVDTDPAYIAKLREKAAIEQQILELRSSSLGALEASRNELIKLRAEAATLDRQYAGFDQVKSGKARIKTLKDQEKQLAKEYEALEQQRFLTEEFIRTKVQMLESKINSKFRHVKFRLFETQVNGAVNETCETLYGERQVPYNNGLNRAAQLNSGLDIINTLSEHYDFIAPIFIDNAEAVTELADTAGQQIRLIVPPAFEHLPYGEKERLIELHGSRDKAHEIWSESNKQLRIELSEFINQEAMSFE